MSGSPASEQLRSAMVSVPAAKLAAGELEQALTAVEKFFEALAARPAEIRGAFAPVLFKLHAIRACARGLLAASSGVEPRLAAHHDVAAALAALDRTPPALSPAGLTELRGHLTGLVAPDPAAAPRAPRRTSPPP